MGHGIASLLAQHALEGAMERGGGWIGKDDEAPLQKNGATGRENTRRGEREARNDGYGG